MGNQSERPSARQQRIAAQSSRVSKNAGACSAHASPLNETVIASSKHGTSDGPNKDRLADLVLPADAKPRQIMRVRAATVLNREIERQKSRLKNWHATNEAIADDLDQNEKFVRGLRDTRNPIEFADLYSLPLWAVDVLIEDLKKARGIS